MPGYILRRLILMVPVLFGISVIVFFIMALIPGDPAQAILGFTPRPTTWPGCGKPWPGQALVAAIFHLAGQSADR